jgi:hypothetical protein
VRRRAMILRISLSPLKKTKITHMTGKKKGTTEGSKIDEEEGIFSNRRDLDPKTSWLTTPLMSGPKLGRPMMLFLTGCIFLLYMIRGIVAKIC